MKSIIKILPDHIANKIAAGEVVERPASVVKEMIENSLDAGADEIFIAVRAGGKDLIQIIDNGRGMVEEDAVLCFERHATSKLANWEDLQTIHSFGFRGEALASIASVSDIEMKTRTVEQDAATHIRIHAGKVANVSKESALAGTSISVKNLFYNVPARKNFLKTNSTEFRHIAGIIKKFAIANPNVEFSLVHDDEKVFQLRKTDIYGRLEKVVGREIMQYTLPFDTEQYGVKIFGFISKPSFSFKTKGEQFLFLNGRPIVNRTANFAAASAYGHSIPRGDKPFFILFLEMDPAEFDVNVHPTKAEVKFKDEQLLYRVVFHSVKDAMGTDAMIPTLSGASSNVDSSQQQSLLNLESPRPSQNSLQNLTYSSYKSDATGERSGADEKTTEFFRSDVSTESPDSKKFIQRQLVAPSSINLNSMVWQLHNRYIVSQIKSGLAFIDQHVAHERILYEKALDAFDQSPIFSQQLLFPQTIEFSNEDFSIIEKFIPLLERLGFVVKVFGKRTMAVEAVPADVRLGNEQKILLDILREYKDHESEAMDPRDNLAKSFACKSAVKSGDPLTVEEMNGLIDQLFATKFPYVCPHGRPIIIQLSLEELDKRFMRI